MKGSALLLGFLFSCIGFAQSVRITGIPEPGSRDLVKANVERWGLRVTNETDDPAALTREQVEDATLRHVHQPLRPIILEEVLDRQNARSFWGIFLTVGKWASTVGSLLQGGRVVQIGGKLQALIPGAAAGLTVIDQIVTSNREEAKRKLLRVPQDYLPETLVVPPRASVTVALFATKQNGAASFRVEIEPLGLLDPRQPVVFEFDAHPRYRATTRLADGYQEIYQPGDLRPCRPSSIECWWAVRSQPHW